MKVRLSHNAATVDNTPHSPSSYKIPHHVMKEVQSPFLSQPFNSAPPIMRKQAIYCTSLFPSFLFPYLNHSCCTHRCYVDDKVSKVAWLNRSNIIFAGQDKWSLDPRVDLVTKGQLEYSLRIQKVMLTTVDKLDCFTYKRNKKRLF